MIKSTFHTHSRYDDGQEELESYITAALEKNFQVFGFSGHAPVNFESIWHIRNEYLDEYINTTKQLKEKYKNRIEIYTGLETDYFDGCTDWRNKRGIDYTIGAVHFMIDEKTGDFLLLDGTVEEFENTLKLFDNDIHALIKAYFSMLRDMLIKMPPNIIAHLDIIRKNNANNAFFDEEDSI